MFKCQLTKRTSRPGEKLNKITALTRNKTYKHFNYELEEEWTSYGSETVLELNATDSGYKMWNAWTDAQRQEWLRQQGFVKDGI